MNTYDSIKATGNVSVTLYDATGNIKHQIQHHNLIVDLGKNFIASRIANNSKIPMNHMALGSGTTTPVREDIQLQDELQNGRISIPSPSVSGNTISFTGIFPGSYATGLVSEAGIFNANSGGTMLCRTVFPAFRKEDTDVVAFSWNITIN